MPQAQLVSVHKFKTYLIADWEDSVIPAKILPADAPPGGPVCMTPAMLEEMLSEMSAAVCLGPVVSLGADVGQSCVVIGQLVGFAAMEIGGGVIVPGVALPPAAGARRT